MMKVLIEYAKSPGAGTPGLFYSVLERGGLIPRLTTDYFFLSSHLQM
jgi:hypothetical protein